MKVVFTNPAKEHLRDIFLYYKEFVSTRVANQIKQTILERSKLLQSFPEQGPIEPLLTSLQRNHRYVIEGNYKMIYYITHETIYITDIFDTRQNPTDMLKRNVIPL